MELDYVYIDTPEQLEKAAKIWRKEPRLAVDLECENNLHHYGVSVALIQISNEDTNWVVDPLAVDVQPVIEFLEDPQKEVIFHDADFDFRILHHEHLCRPRGLFDTQIACLFTGREKVGLGNVLEDYFGVQPQKKFQMADWTKRPLKEAMLQYAVMDTAYLLELARKLKQELQDLGRLSWVKEECKLVEDKALELNQGSLWSFKGIGRLSDQQRAILKRLYNIRDKLAQKTDKPVHFIISNKRLRELIERLPKDWGIVRGVHPIVRRYAKRFAEAVQKGKKERLPMPEKTRKRMNAQQIAHAERLNALRDKKAQELDLPKHLILSKEQIKDIVLHHHTHSLKSWQQNLLADEGAFWKP